MSRYRASRTVLTMAKKLRRCTDAQHIKIVRVVERAARATRTPYARALLALRELEADGHWVDRSQLETLIPASGKDRDLAEVHMGAMGESTSLESQGGYASAMQMPTTYPSADDPRSPSHLENRPLTMMRWWLSGRSLGIYGAQREDQALFVRELMSQLMGESVRFVVPMRKFARPDYKTLLAVTEIVDLSEHSDGMTGFLGQIQRSQSGDAEVALLVDASYGLTEEDRAALVSVVTRPGLGIRVIYTESYALRGWDELMNAALDYAESVFLGPARSVDLEAVGVPADYRVPEGKGAGIYCSDGGYIVRFGAASPTPAYELAHRANQLWGPCGSRPPCATMALLTEPGDVMFFWGDESDQGWTVVTSRIGTGVVRRDTEAGPRYRLFSFGYGLRETRRELAQDGINDEMATDFVRSLGPRDVHFTEGAVRLDVNSLERDGDVIWIDED
ncbi:hypothetical protein GMA12_09700 [Kocuria sediminis]|uniref:Uncharacterized protein n=1 Tax=Kocuria sediminis TaxID=1038857 RepID=A0A6N8GMC3_9MICC|nr:hypothetical protein [Kocuria sediminis]MUN63410.1 hypothetical protein [Kocuria sediminis]